MPLKKAEDFEKEKEEKEKKKNRSSNLYSHDDEEMKEPAKNEEYEAMLKEYHMKPAPKAFPLKDATLSQSWLKVPLLTTLRSQR